MYIEQKIGKTDSEIIVVKFSHWVTISKTRRRPYFLCRCTCKKEFICRGDGIKTVKGCGCNKDTAWGERNPQASLKNYEAAAIRELKNTNNFTQREIGEIFGINETQVSSIVLGKTYLSHKDKKIKET